MNWLRRRAEGSGGLIAFDVGNGVVPPGRDRHQKIPGQFDQIGQVPELGRRRLSRVDRAVVAGLDEDPQRGIQAQRHRHTDPRNPGQRHQERKDRGRQQVVGRVLVLALKLCVEIDVAVIAVQEQGAEGRVEACQDVERIQRKIHPPVILFSAVHRDQGVRLRRVGRSGTAEGDSEIRHVKAGETLKQSAVRTVRVCDEDKTDPAIRQGLLDQSTLLVAGDDRALRDPIHHERRVGKLFLPGVGIRGHGCGARQTAQAGAQDDPALLD